MALPDAVLAVGALRRGNASAGALSRADSAAVARGCSRAGRANGIIVVAIRCGTVAEIIPSGP